MFQACDGVFPQTHPQLLVLYQACDGVFPQTHPQLWVLYQRCHVTVLAMFYDSVLPEPLPASCPLSGAAKLHLSEGQPGCLLGGQQITFLEDSQAVLVTQWGSQLASLGGSKSASLKGSRVPSLRGSRGPSQRGSRAVSRRSSRRGSDEGSGSGARPGPSSMVGISFDAAQTEYTCCLFKACLGGFGALLNCVLLTPQQVQYYPFHFRNFASFHDGGSHLE
eukprot:1159879-Pelagomonas_calceolata.AAC.3